MIGRKAAREGSEKPQKNSVLRTLQLLQSSSIGKPYGVRVLPRSSGLWRKLETSGLSATIEFGIWPFPPPPLSVSPSPSREATRRPNWSNSVVLVDSMQNKQNESFILDDETRQGTLGFQNEVRTGSFPSKVCDLNHFSL
jgi:hypothetical protein